MLIIMQANQLAQQQAAARSPNGHADYFDKCISLQWPLLCGNTAAPLNQRWREGLVHGYMHNRAGPAGGPGRGLIKKFQFQNSKTKKPLRVALHGADEFSALRYIVSSLARIPARPRSA